VALAQHGLGYAVATLGTACTPEQVRLLFRFSDTVVFAFDGDSAGRRAARKALQAALPWASDTRSVKFLFLPPEHDPDSYVRAHGAPAFEQALAQATPLSRFVLDAAAEGCALDTPEGRARLASQAAPLWQALPEGAFKHQMLLELADLVALDGRDLLALWQPKFGQPQTRQSKTAPAPRARRASAGTATHLGQPYSQTSGAATEAPLVRSVISFMAKSERLKRELSGWGSLLGLSQFFQCRSTCSMRRSGSLKRGWFKSPVKAPSLFAAARARQKLIVTPGSKVPISQPSAPALDFILSGFPHNSPLLTPIMGSEGQFLLPQ